MNNSEDKAHRQQQAAALCLKHRKGKLSVLMITSRKTKRWILPKGWLEEDKTEAEVALMEAWEEAGVIALITTSNACAARRKCPLRSMFTELPLVH